MEGFDSSSISSAVVPTIVIVAAPEDVGCVLPMYLPRSNLGQFLGFFHKLAEMRCSGLSSHISEVAFHAPLHGSFGGTSERGMWGMWAPEVDAD